MTLDQAETRPHHEPLARTCHTAEGPAVNIPERLRILVIGAHPADIFDQSGGTMAHHVKRGDWVGCVVLTHGARVHDKVVVSEMFHRDRVPVGEELEKVIAARTSIKGNEVREACRILGVSDLYFMDVDDSVLLLNEALIRRLARLIRKTRPNIIITHYPKEDGGISSPHAITGQMVLFARNLAMYPDGEDDTKPHRIAQMFFWGQGGAPIRTGLWHAEGGHSCDVLIDITDVIELKLKAMDTIESQGYAGNYARKRLESTDGAWGKAGGVPYAESFISLYSSTHYYLPLSPINLAHSMQSDQERLIRISYRTPSSYEPYQPPQGCAGGNGGVIPSKAGVAPGG
ncbi:MAG TPA: PIG-L deacetylase family protein [Gemmatimonadaceae bacterium]